MANRIPHRHGLRQEAPGNDCRKQHDRTHIQEQRKPAGHSAKRLKEGAAPGHCRLELRQSLIDQVKADMGRAVVAAVSWPRPRGPIGSPGALPRFRSAGWPWRSSPRHGGSGHGWQNSSCHRRREDPYARSARPRSASRRRSRQSIAPRKRRLPMLLLMET